MIIDILQHTPVWVWILLAAVVGLGLLQTRDRAMSRARVTILPIVFILLSLSGVFRGAGSSLVAPLAWAAGFGAVLAFGRNALAVRGASWSPQSARLQVPGSWLPVALIVSLFMLKYGMAVAQALEPRLLQQTTLQVACNALYGAFSAIFWSRSRSLLRLIPREAAPEEGGDERVRGTN